MLPRVSHVKGDRADFLLFSTNDLISNTIYRTGTWEDHLLRITKIFYQGVDKPLILDIGANLGAYSVPIAKDILSSGGKIIAFEPQRVIYYQLCANIFLNRLDNVYAYNQAVGDLECSVSIPDIDYKSNENVGAFSLTKEFRERHGIENSMLTQASPVEMITLDNLVLEKSPDFIKIDVEGYELNVLKGATEFLKSHSWPPILFEAWSFEWFSEERKKLIAFVESLGYCVTSLNASDYIAQHPEHSVAVSIIRNDNGTIQIGRTK